MIAKLKGLVEQVGEDWAVIDVGGVGYLVFCPTRTLSRLPRPGEAVALFIETHVREDHIHLYGFIEEAERAWFRLLMTVPGVGSKVALALLSVHAPEALSRAIAAGDKAALSQAAGVGAKLAARLAAELKDKAAQITPSFAPLRTAAATAATGAVDDAVSALLHLGYRPMEAHEAIAKAIAAQGEDASVAALVRAGLKELGKELAR
jgi:Holliday junction DNA helicase RuvA